MDANALKIDIFIARAANLKMTGISIAALLSPETMQPAKDLSGVNLKILRT